MKSIEIHTQLRKSGFRLFTHREFQRIIGATPVAAKFLLIRYTRRGFLRRIKRGLYTLADPTPSSWAIANHLYQPSYISLTTALSHYGLIPETVYSVTSVTTKATREFGVQGVSYSYRTIKRNAFRGYRAVEMGEERVLIAEKEKALADYLYFVFLKKERLNPRLVFRGVNANRVTEHVRTFASGSFLKWYRHDFKIPD